MKRSTSPPRTCADGHVSIHSAFTPRVRDQLQRSRWFLSSVEYVNLPLRWKRSCRSVFADAQRGGGSERARAWSIVPRCFTGGGNNHLMVPAGAETRSARRDASLSPPATVTASPSGSASNQTPTARAGTCEPSSTWSHICFHHRFHTFTLQKQQQMPAILF